jgi:single-strand DNA-binding protein
VRAADGPAIESGFRVVMEWRDAIIDAALEEGCALEDGYMKAGSLPPDLKAARKVKALCSLANRADLVGNVTRDPEMRTTTSGQKVLTIGVATNERWKDKASGEMKDKSEFHNVVVWGDLAEEVMNGIKKGNRVFVTGRIQTRSWETQAGAKRYTTEIIAETVSLLGVSSPVAREALSSDSAAAGYSAKSPSDSQARPAAKNEENQDVAYAGVPDISYAPEIKVEDLPF